MSASTLACLILFALHEPHAGTPKDEAVRHCERVWAAAEAAGEEPTMVVSIAAVESRFNAAARSDQGAVGLMQVIPKFWCRDGRRDCDHVQAGIRAWKHWQEVAEEIPGGNFEIHALCHYAIGNKYAGRGCGYGVKVVKLERKLASLLGVAKRRGM